MERVTAPAPALVREPVPLITPAKALEEPEVFRFSAETPVIAPLTLNEPLVTLRFAIGAALPVAA